MLAYIPDIDEIYEEADKLSDEWISAIYCGRGEDDN